MMAFINNGDITRFLSDMQFDVWDHISFYSWDPATATFLLLVIGLYFNCNTNTHRNVCVNHCIKEAVGSIIREKFPVVESAYAMALHNTRFDDAVITKDQTVTYPSLETGPSAFAILIKY